MRYNKETRIETFKKCMQEFNHFSIQVYNHEFHDFIKSIPRFNNFDQKKSSELLTKIAEEKTNGLHDYTIEIGQESSLCIYFYLNYVIADNSEYKEKIDKEFQKFEWIAKNLDCDEFNMIKEDFQIKFRLWWD